MSRVLIGCDPEGFLVDGNGDFISAYGIIPGDKMTPFSLDGGAVQVDGMAIEFNIDPAETAEQFNGNINKVLYQIEEKVHSIDKDINILWTPVAHFKKTIWELSPEQCKILGCDPDFNVDGEVNANPTLKLENTPLRTAAGHIHVGFLDNLVEDPNNGSHFDLCLDIAKGFNDAKLWSFTPHTKEEFERLNYYGGNGAFRPKKYGIELRAPSNLWVRDQSSRTRIFEETRKTFKELTGL